MSPAATIFLVDPIGSGYTSPKGHIKVRVTQATPPSVFIFIQGLKSSEEAEEKGTLQPPRFLRGLYENRFGHD